MKKKAQGLSINTIIILILGIVILVILILGFTLGWDKVAPFWIGENRVIFKDDFTIYKEECVNETTYADREFLYAFWGIEDAKIDLNEKYSYCKILYSENKYLEGCEDYNAILEALESKQDELSKARKESKTIIEVCEQIEVDKIIVCCLNISDGPNIENTTICMSEEKLEFFEVPCEPLNKEDLKTEWLNENCECINCPCKSLGKECEWATKEDCLRNCKKYKFGSYTVEIEE